METSSPEQPKVAEPKSILLIGPPGGGKTTLALQFPGVCILDCDRNLDGPEKYLRGVKPDLQYFYEKITYDDKGKAVPVEECYDKVIRVLQELGNKDEVQTIVIDGLTMINEFIIQKILKEQGKDEMESRHWGPFKSKMIALLVGGLRDTGKTTICTCHELTVTQPNKQDMMNPLVTGYKPSVNGKITDFFGGFFTDMWRCTSEEAPGNKLEFQLKVNRTTMCDLKNTLAFPAEGFTWNDGELGYEKIREYLP